MALMGGATSESQRFRQMLDGIFGRAQVPGAAVGVFEGDSSHLYTLGSLAVDDPRPVDADTPFQLGSTTKAFTALALMRLSSEGKLDLDTPVQHYLPTFRVRDATASRMVTTRHLLTHAAGFEGDFCRDTGHGDEALSIALEAMRDLEQLHPPGTMWSYCNAGYSVAARLVEVIADESYEEAIRRLLLAPLDVEGIGFGTAAFGDTPLAEGHELGARGSSRLWIPGSCRGRSMAWPGWQVR